MTNLLSWKEKQIRDLISQAHHTNDISLKHTFYKNALNLSFDEGYFSIKEGVYSIDWKYDFYVYDKSEKEDRGHFDVKFSADLGPFLAFFNIKSVEQEGEFEPQSETYKTNIIDVEKEAMIEVLNTVRDVIQATFPDKEVILTTSEYPKVYYIVSKAFSFTEMKEVIDKTMKILKQVAVLASQKLKKLVSKTMPVSKE